MDPQVYIDIARYAHILAVAIGFGAAFLTDMYALARLGQLIDQSFISSLRTYHTTIWFSVIAMWITGVIMIYIRTGFDLNNFSPKLFSKILIVAILTLNAKVISKMIMPLIEGSRGQSLFWLPLRTKIFLAAVGAISTSSWMLALAMGSSKVLAASGWMVFGILLPIVYGGALVLAAAAMSLLHIGANLEPRRAVEAPTASLLRDRKVPMTIRARG